MSEQAKHTPGPWRVEIEPDCRDEPVIVAADHDWNNSRFVATCHGGLDDDERVQHINARLIAAAPELLMLLQTLLRKFENCARSHGNNDEVIATAAEPFRAAIAKLTGAAT